MSMYVRQHRWAMRIPDHVYKLVLKTLKSIRLLTQSLRREPTPEEIARRLNIDVRHLHQILAWLSAETVSLDFAVGEDDKSTLADFISEEQRLWKASTRRRDEEAEFEELQKLICGGLRTLTKEEQYVLTHRFGLKRAVSKPVKAIARRAHLEPTAVLNTEQRALRKLKRRLILPKPGF
jgi:RNA polymerase primary sigma factor